MIAFFFLEYNFAFTNFYHKKLGYWLDFNG